MIEGYDPHDAAIFSSATLYDSARRLGLSIGLRGLSPLSKGRRLVAPAYTLRFVRPERASAAKLNFYDVIAAGPKGSVLIAEVGLDDWVCGSNTTRFAELSGLAGMVLDACVRDAAVIRDREFPVFGRGAAVTTYADTLVMSCVDEPICCAGVDVATGDLIVGDEDGVVCVPASRLKDVLFQAAEIAGLDATLEGDIEAGKPLSVLHETRLRWSVRRPA